MKVKLIALLASACLSSTVIANPVSENDLDKIFTATNGVSHVSQLSDKEMSETQGAVFWFYPILVQAFIIAPTVILTATQVSQIMRKIPVTQILKSTRSYKIRNQVKQQIKNILD